MDRKIRSETLENSIKMHNNIKTLSVLATNLSSKLNGRAHAISAIRTKPQRTYTPGIEKEDGEGTHVPYEIARQYRTRIKDKTGWDNLHNTLQYFGESANLFKDIVVRSFGRSVSDPFQIQISFDAPKINISDVGYGVSQVLPIVYNMATSSSMDRLLMQQPEVHLHPKAQAALGEFIVRMHKFYGTLFVIETHSDFIVDRIRMNISKNIINKDDVSILFFERKKLESDICEIKLDEKGVPINPPASYRSFFIDEQISLLGF